MNTLSQTINQLLPQTQCRECGYDGCLPYAEALANHAAAHNLCAPGGEIVMQDLSALLNKAPVAPQKIQAPQLAWIDENVCIGCTACIRACPVDAIMGASKLMHTVIADECTGCGLCVAPCPVDCIYMQPCAEPVLPRNRYLADTDREIRFQSAQHALQRYEWHTERKQRDEAERRAHLKEREAAAKAAAQAKAAQAARSASAARDARPAKPAFNPNDLIAKAMARAQAQQAQRTVPANREAFRETQLKEAQERATYRRAMRDMQYGSDSEKAAALQWLRAYKAEQEAKAEGK